MKIFFSPTSPYVRKCLVTAHELGIADRIEKIVNAAHPINRDANIVAANPTGQVPTFVCDDGTPLFDSIVICEYLDDRFGRKLFPTSGPDRWKRLIEHAAADGLLGAALLGRYELTLRPEALRWPDWLRAQQDKIRSSVAWIEGIADSLPGRVDIGTISMACALGYLDFRFADLNWRQQAPRTATWFATFAARDSMTKTTPPA